MGPLYKFEWFDAAYGLQLAGLIGFFFGFVLERAGFGDARKLTAVFYLRDFAVLKVMFTAIVVCMIGLLYFSVFGWIDLSRVHVLPTYLWPQMVGGLVLGIGFVMGGYCPTTSVVAAVSGKLDALIFLVGMILGVFLFAELFPLLKEFYRAGSMGPYLLSDVFGVHSGVIAFLACVMAVGVYWIVEKVEQRFGDAERLPRGSKGAKRTAAAVFVLLGLVLAIVNPDRISVKRATPAPVEPVKKREILMPTAPKTEKPASPRFEIVEDEGC